MKQLVLGVTAGIAAYKSAEIVRLFVRAGWAVQVIMTPAAQAFVAPLTFQALSGRAVRDSLLDPQAELGMGHIELARWADCFLIAPASADCLSRLAQGMANDLLTTTILASQAPLYLAPAMNRVMWANPLVQANLDRLRALRPGTEVLGPGAGEQACGDVGEGRMLEPAMLFDMVQSLREAQDARPSVGTPSRDGMSEQAPAQTKGGSLALRITVTAGPTRERLDPVRYLSNDSSGKMGYAIAEAAALRGAEVTLVSGPVHQPVPGGVCRVSVESAREMLTAVQSAVSAGCDIFIAAAAVADYRPEQAGEQKLKKTGEQGLVLQLVQNPDILAWVGHSGQVPCVVGFAAETDRVLEHARQKLQRKGAHIIVANDVSRSDIGFDSNDNEVTLVTDSEEEPLPRQSKKALAACLLERILECHARLVVPSD